VEQAGFLQSDRESGDLQIHRLTQQVVRADIKPTELNVRFAEAVAVVKNCFPDEFNPSRLSTLNSNFWHLADDCLPHVLQLEALYREFKVSLAPDSVFRVLLSATAWYVPDAITHSTNSTEICTGTCTRLVVSNKLFKSLLQPRNFVEATLSSGHRHAAREL
jgi:hypothetical protein